MEKRVLKLSNAFQRALFGGDNRKSESNNENEKEILDFIFFVEHEGSAPQENYHELRQAAAQSQSRRRRVRD